MPLPVADEGMAEFLQPHRWREQSEAGTVFAAKAVSVADWGIDNPSVCLSAATSLCTREAYFLQKQKQSYNSRDNDHGDK